MDNEITFSMIKPEAVAAGHAGAILGMIEKAGFSIVALKLTRLTKEQAGRFYSVHSARPFYHDLCEYMSSGKILALVLSKNQAVEDFRKLIGATDPQKAAAGTVRRLFAQSIQANAIHGSDSPENAVKEAAFFFSSLEFHPD